MILAACVFLTAGVLFYVFGGSDAGPTAAPKTRLIYLRERKEVVYDNLRDLNFEFKAGKFPEGDYQTMRAGLEDEAARILAEIDVLERTQ